MQISPRKRKRLYIFHKNRFQIAKGDYKFKKASNMQKISWNDDLAILGLSMCFDEFLSKIFVPGYN